MPCVCSLWEVEDVPRYAAAEGEGDRVTALLEIVAELREVRDTAHAEFVAAIKRAHTEGGYSGTTIAKAAGLSKQRISQLLREVREVKS